MEAKQQQQSEFAATIARFKARDVNIFYCRGALGTRLDQAKYHQMRADRRIRFEYATCRRGNL